MAGYSVTHILLIDERTEHIEALLRSGDVAFDLLAASSVSAALELLEHRRLDVVLVDARILAQANLHFRNLPIIVLGDDEREATRAIAAGAQDYLAWSTLTPPLLSRAVRYAIERHTMLRKLERLSLTDELTGLYNRRGFFLLGEQQLESARRASLSSAMIYLDVDGLKRINDTFGHAAGDRLLADTGAILAATFRSADIVARIGGDEFAILAQMSASCAAAPELRLLAGVDARNERHRDLPPILLSIGIQVAEASDTRSLEALLGAADGHMYAGRRERTASPPPSVPALDSRLSTRERMYVAPGESHSDFGCAVRALDSRLSTLDSS